MISDFLDDDRLAAADRPPRASRTRCCASRSSIRASSRFPAAGMLTLVDTETGRDIHVQTNSASLRDRYAAAARERHEAIGRRIRDAGSEHLVLSTDADWLIEIVRFVAGRKTLRRHTSLSRNSNAAARPA